MKTYTEKEVLDLLNVALRDNTLLSAEVRTQKAENLLHPKMTKPKIYESGKGYFTVAAQDENGVEWSIVSISSKGVYFHPGISDASGWDLDSLIEGEMGVVDDFKDIV